MKFISVDPSLANTGVIWGEIINGKINLNGYKLIQTEKSKDKKIRSSSDLSERCRQIYQELTEIIVEFKPVITFVETPSGSQSYSSALSYGISCYTVGIINPPPIQVTPIEVKKATVGTKTATKKEIIDYVENKYPDFLLKKGGKVLNYMEHIADAVCVTEAGLKTNEFKQLMSILK